MSPLLIIFASVVAILQLALPKRLAYLPLLVAVFHAGNQPVLFGDFTTVRIVIILGTLRALFSGHLRFSFGNSVDRLFVLFSIIALISTLAHGEAEYNPLTERLGLVLNLFGTYLYARAYTTDRNFLYSFSSSLAIVLIPLAVFMAAEKQTRKNFYYNLGARSELASFKEDDVRAKGPFGHAILAGTAAATAFPFMVFLYRRRKKLAIAGGASSAIVTLASVSSGSIAALLAAIAFVYAWRWRHRLALAKKLFIPGIILLDLIMTSRVWFLIARIDIVGGSTGYHRAKLIDNAIKYLDEWWLFGTDYTRHWMHSGVTWSQNHTDITNYYLQLGVIGGLPLMICFILIIYKSLGLIERGIESFRLSGEHYEFGLWCLWSSIMAQCVAMISIAYFDQTYAYFFLLIGSALATAANSEAHIDIDDASPNTTELSESRAYS